MFWYEDEVKHLERKKFNTTEPYTVFYGSSSIRMWGGLETSLPLLNPINLGFGGSTLAACTWFFDRIMAPYHPEKIVVYAGDNDLSDGRHPEEIFIFFQELTARVSQRFGAIPCYFISVKPSISRWNLIEQIKYTNKLIEEEININHPNWHFADIFSHMLGNDGLPKKEYFLPDGLHLSAAGYSIWQNVIQKQITTNS